MTSATDTDPDRASFTIALNTARDQIIHAASVIAGTVIDLIGAIGRAVLNDLLPNRRIRISPRVVNEHLQTPRQMPHRPHQPPRRDHHHHHPVDNQPRALTTRHCR